MVLYHYCIVVRDILLNNSILSWRIVLLRCLSSPVPIPVCLSCSWLLLWPRLYVAQTLGCVTPHFLYVLTSYVHKFCISSGCLTHPTSLLLNSGTRNYAGRLRMNLSTIFIHLPAIYVLPSHDCRPHRCYYPTSTSPSTYNILLSSNCWTLLTPLYSSHHSTYPQDSIRRLLLVSPAPLPVAYMRCQPCLHCPFCYICGLVLYARCEFHIVDAEVGVGGRRRVGLLTSCPTFPCAHLVPGTQYSFLRTSVYSPQEDRTSIS